MGSGASKAKDRAPSERLESRNKRVLIRTLGGHTGGINCMDVSSESNILLTGSDDRTARVWDLMTFDCKVVLEGHGGYISCCKIWQDRFAITGSSDKTIRKWNIMSGNCVMKLEHHKGIVNRMLTYGDFLFTTAYDGIAVCWHLRNGEVVRVFRGHAKSVLPLAYVESVDHDPLGATDLDRNKDTLITGSMDQTARMWNVSSGASLKTFKGHKGAVLSLAVDMENRVLFTGSTDHTIKKWNLRNGALLKSFRGHEASVICLQTHGRLLYSASVDTTARCWVAEFGDTTRKFVGHDHMISDMKYLRGIVFTGSGDASVKAFDAKSGTLKRTFKGHKHAVNCLLTHESLLLSASYDGSVKIWNIRDILKDRDTASTATLSSQTSSSMSAVSANGIHRGSISTEAAITELQEPRENGVKLNPTSILHNGNSQQTPGTKREPAKPQESVNRSHLGSKQQRRPRRGHAGKVLPQVATRNANDNNNKGMTGNDGNPNYLDFDYINNQLQDLLEDEEYWAGSSTHSSVTNIKAATTATNSSLNDDRSSKSKASVRSGSGADVKDPVTSRPSTNGTQHRSETRELVKRESSSLLKKRPRTESNASARSRVGKPALNDAALVDEEMRMVAMETASNTSGYRTAENNSMTSSPTTTPARRTSAGSQSTRSSKKSSVSFSPAVSTNNSPAKTNTKKPTRRVETSGIRNKAKLKHQDSTISNGSVARDMTSHERKLFEQEILDMV